MPVGGFPLIVLALAAVAVVIGVPVLRPPRRAPRAPEPLEPLVSAILDALPGGNCGACGNDSCFEAATAVARGRASCDVCASGGPATASAVAAAVRAHKDTPGSG